MRKILLLLVLVVLSAVMLSACTKSSDEGGGGAVISMKGGEGTVGYGGNGPEYFYVQTREGNQIKIQRSGSVDTKFDTELADNVITNATASFGAVPFDVKKDTTVLSYATGTWPAAGTVFTRATYTYDNCFPDGCIAWNYDSGLYSSNGTSVPNVVTGIRVHPGVTLTFAPNIEWNESTALSQGLYEVFIDSLSKDVVNEGTIKVMDLVAGAAEVGATGTRVPTGTANDMAGLDIETGGSWVNNGRIDLNGKDSDTAGGGAGWFYAWADGVAINRGSIHTSGGDGTNGGGANSAVLDSNYGTWNSGPITAKGGKGKNGTGGSGDEVSLSAQEYPGPVFNSATIDVSGGNGTDGGGNAGNLNFSTGQSEARFAGGDMVNSGSIIGNGGDATTLGSGGDGADSIDFQANGANVRNSGSVEIKGGTGKGEGSIGGYGGYLNVWTDWSRDPYHSDQQAAGSITYSGKITTDGGSGETGQTAGDVQFYQRSYPATGDIVLVGYSNINLMGGKGKTSGGDGGYVDIEVYSGSQAAESTILNEANIDTTGGEGMTTNGGYGGDVYIDADYNSYANPIEMFMLENTGDITTMGGKGVTSGGGAGYVELYSAQNAKNTGHLNATGADASGAEGIGGHGSYVYVWAIGSILNTGTIETSGGFGKAFGGNGDQAQLLSENALVINSANIFANGGNTSADGTNGSAYTSDGPAIDLESSYNFNAGPFETQNTGTLKAKAGTGGTGGSPGDIVIDNVLQ